MARLLYTAFFMPPSRWSGYACCGAEESRRNTGSMSASAMVSSTGNAAPILWLHAVSGRRNLRGRTLIAGFAGAPSGSCAAHPHDPDRSGNRPHVRGTLPGTRRSGLPALTCRTPPAAFGHFRPRIGPFMETELWPNLIAAAGSAGIPAALVNGRLSARSQRGYQRLGR